MVPEVDLAWRRGIRPEPPIPVLRDAHLGEALVSSGVVRRVVAVPPGLERSVAGRADHVVRR